jgi:glycosyltransferase involved in cell wall biosynthesis
MTLSTSNQYPTLSIIIVTKNVARTFARLLKDIENQDYPKNKIEVIVVDGASTDDTLSIIKKSNLPIRVMRGKYPDDPEACKGQGLSYAKGEIVALIDSDNYLPHTHWFKKMIIPLMQHNDIVGSYTWRFAYNKDDNMWNRYFSLIGSADPVGLYLGKADKISYISDKLIGFGKILTNTKEYYIVEFDKNHFPTLGSNGFFARRKYLIKGDIRIQKFFHIDVPYDILKFQLNKYAVVKDVIIHDTAITLQRFIVKRINYMKLHYQSRSKDRRYKVFDPDSDRDIKKLILFVLFSMTLIQPTYVAIRGYLKIRDPAWFLHPVFCFFIALAYSYAVIIKGIAEITRSVKKLFV